jgi:protein gp37
MAEKSNIEWTEATWNPWYGCLKVSPGCKLCYMYREMARYGRDPRTVTRSKTKFNDPLKWVKAGNEPKFCFTCSWSDFFIEQADEWRAEAWKIIAATPQITYQILTKRPDRVLEHLPADWGQGYKNVWLGVSAENQEYADERIPILLNTPAAVRWVSAEPLLGPITFRWAAWDKHQTHSRRVKQLANVERDGKVIAGAVDHLDGLRMLDWIVVGGESGSESRPMEMIWAHQIAEQCIEAKTPFFMKQLGGKADKRGDIKQFPTGLQIRQWPAEPSHAH